LTEDTRLLRQINPAFLQQGQPSSQAFRPTPKDRGLLSAYDGDLITPEASWRHYTDQLGLSSCGVLALTVAECMALDLPVRPDPDPFPEHAVVDFTAFTAGQTERLSKKLRDRAAERGWLYLAEGGP
jgi:hypothetical protein